jgi:hypothetical protein
VLVLDYAWARPSPAAIAGAGYSGVLRYLSFEPSKNLSPAERDGLWAAGLSIGLVWEATAQAPLQGFSRGQSDARNANDQADALGWPGNVVIIYAVDFDARTMGSVLAQGVTLSTAVDVHRKTALNPYGAELVRQAMSAQMDQVADYFRGVRSVGRRPSGVYGPDHVLDSLAASVGLDCYWQCAAWSGWGEGTGGSIYVPGYGRNVQLSRQACLFQFYGSTRLGETDHNESTGQAGHHLADLMYHPDGHEPEEEEDDMPGWSRNQILWSVVDSAWARDIAGMEGGPHAFIADPNSRRMLHIPTEESLNWERYAMGATGGDIAQLEHHDVPDVVLRGYTLDGPGGASDHPHNQKCGRTVDVDLGEIEVDGMKVDLTPEAIASVATATADEQYRRQAQ